MNILNFDLQCIPVEMDLNLVCEHLRRQPLVADQTTIVIRLIPDELIYRLCCPYYHSLVATRIFQELSDGLPDFGLDYRGVEIESGRVIFRFRLAEKIPVDET